MRKQIALLGISLILVSGIFGLTTKIPHFAKGTYVEGIITQNTDWTLIDSPFVLSSNVTIIPGATLTIEPGVEVKFGGHFSLLVEGNLLANGIEDKKINFTSNMLEPKSGAWGTIRFSGTGQSSLNHCTIEYGTDGIIAENGFLTVQNSLVRFNSEYGIALMEGNSTVQSNQILNNGICGIHVEGGNTTIEDNSIESNGEGVYIQGGAVTVKNNSVKSNVQGIILDGNPTSKIDIEQNVISLSALSGMLLNAAVYTDITVLSNTLRANNYGFYVSSNVSTLITRNYVENNTVGIFYANGIDHQAHFNDIYGNGIGMDLAQTSSVNATYNYWGDNSGPRHETMNPRGKGNEARGDGINLVFIFYLSAPIDHSNSAPTAILWTDKTRVAPNQGVTFVGADSWDEGRVDRYFYDFGDGTNSGWTTLSVFNHTYSLNGTYVASLRVIDDFNAISENDTVAVTVENLPLLNASITLSSITVNYTGEISVTVYVSKDTGEPAENADILLLSVKGGSFNTSSGLTDSAGYFSTVFTAPNVTDITDIRIIARASLSTYADASDHEYLKVLPPLSVQADVTPSVIKSEEQATVNVLLTLGSEIPISDALLTLTCDSGSLSPSGGTTDPSGRASFTYSAPQTLTQLHVVIGITAVKIGYSNALGQTTIDVEPRRLFVSVTASPPTIISEATSIITAHITSDAVPISNANVSATTEVGGNFSTSSATTDMNGNVTFTFNAPQVTSRDGLTGTIILTANKEGYVDGEGRTTIAIVPKVLVVELTVNPNTTTSETRVNITAHVAYLYDMSPISDSNVTFTCQDEGNLSVTSGMTDDSGDLTAFLITPPVDQTKVITVNATATRNGYVDGEDSASISLSPGILDVEVSSSTSNVASNGTSTITVLVTSNSTPVMNVSIAMSSNYGHLEPSNGLTDSTGHCMFNFRAPETTSQLTVTIAANATKFGYLDNQNQTRLYVSPTMPSGEGGGWPLTTILLIIIPVIIAIVLVVLIKTRILVLSSKDQEGELS